MFVFDSHAHIIPPLARASGYADPDSHLAACQEAMRDHLSQPPRRVMDNGIISGKKLWDPDDLSRTGRLDTGFRVGEYGRFEWNQDGEDCYIQYLPTYAAGMEYPPGMLKAAMDYAGVHKAVLQCGGVYGRLNRYYAEVMRKHPELKEVFCPLAGIEPAADPAKAVKELKRCIGEDHLSGVWIVAEDKLFDFSLNSFWDGVRRLGVPVFLAFFPDDQWCKRILAMEDWIKDYPDLPIVLPQAFPLSAGKDSVLKVPDKTAALLYKGRFLAEIIYPISQGNREDYPFKAGLRAVRKLYEMFGASKLVWGSDIPMVERYCTYIQSLTYLTRYCDFISAVDLASIIGTNMENYFLENQ